MQVGMQRGGLWWGVSLTVGGQQEGVGWEEDAEQERHNTGRHVCIKFLSFLQSPQSTDAATALLPITEHPKLIPSC